jgi:type III secretory pathway component EscR
MDEYQKSREEQIIESYRRDEDMMILVFAQWCVNNGLDPHALYLQAYPEQENNEALRRAIALTVPEEEAGYISDDTVLGVLSLFGNDDLAFVVTGAIADRAPQKGTGD